MNKKDKAKIKLATRDFVKELPDVHEATYYVLADIRNRLELDVDDEEEDRKSGKKKIKKDLIAEIREKKFNEIKAMQLKKR